MDSCSHINEISFNVIGEWTVAVILLRFLLILLVNGPLPQREGSREGWDERGVGTQTGARRERKKKRKKDSHPENLSHNIIRGGKLRRIEPWPSSKK